jgi:hypothetical protein
MPQMLLKYKFYKGIVIVYQHTGFPLLCFPQVSLDRPSSLLPSAQYTNAVLAVPALCYLHLLTPFLCVVNKQINKYII